MAAILNLEWNRKSEGRQAFEAAALAAELKVVGITEASIPACRLPDGNNNQLRRISYRQGAPKNRVNQAENCSVCANTQGHHQYRRDRKTRTAPPASQTIS